jgi:hypothetical protein
MGVRAKSSFTSPEDVLKSCVERDFTTLNESMLLSDITMPCGSVLHIVVYRLIVTSLGVKHFSAASSISALRAVELVWRYLLRKGWSHEGVVLARIVC